jgi:hypothetical protein
MGNVVINGLTAVHAGSGGVLNTVDVCKVPNKCRANTFNNVALSSDAAQTAGSVIVNGNIKQKAEFITFSNNVFIEGIPAVRQTDLMVSNNRNTPPAPLQQPGAGQPPALSPQDTTSLNGSALYTAGINITGDEPTQMHGLIEFEEV